MILIVLTGKEQVPMEDLGERSGFLIVKWGRFLCYFFVMEGTLFRVVIIFYLPSIPGGVDFYVPAFCL
jgi:hypothetical protein